MYYKFVDMSDKSWTVYGETENVAKRNFKKLAHAKFKAMMPIPGFGVKK